MKIKAVIIDFDETITTRDMSDLLAKKVGKQAESAALNQQFFEGRVKGLTGLVRRINFLKGMTRQELEALVAQNDYIRAGSYELFRYFKQNQIVSIIASGSTIAFLEIYQRKLDADYLVGSRPKMDQDTIVSIDESDYSGADFKVRDSKSILDNLGITPAEVVAIGDSPADRGLFEFAAKSIGVNPRPQVKDMVDYTIKDDLSLVIPILEGLRQQTAVS